MEKEVCGIMAGRFAEKDWNSISDKDKYLVTLLIKGKYLNQTDCPVIKSAAKMYAGRDWHKLSESQREVVDALEKNGHLIPNKPANGFVGKLA